MSYETFISRVTEYLTASGESHESVMFSHDFEKGRHIALCPGGIKIFGNTISPRITVKWGSGHQATARV